MTCETLSSQAADCLLVNTATHGLLLAEERVLLVDGPKL